MAESLAGVSIAKSFNREDWTSTMLYNLNMKTYKHFKHLWCVSILIMQFQMDPTEAFYWAHDVSSKVIGFFGTILFAFIIERIGGVPIIDQFADWLDWMWWRLTYIKSKLESFLG